MEITYREITTRDRRALSRLAWRSFGGIGSWMIALERGGHAAFSGDRLVGATILTSFRAGRQRVGLLSWIMVDG